MVNGGRVGWAPAPCHWGPPSGATQPGSRVASATPCRHHLWGAGPRSHLMASSMSLKDRSASSNLLRASWAAVGAEWGKVRAPTHIQEEGEGELDTPASRPQEGPAGLTSCRPHPAAQTPGSQGIGARAPGAPWLPTHEDGTSQQHPVRRQRGPGAGRGGTGIPSPRCPLQAWFFGAYR